MTIRWFPGHMHKARREIKARLKDVDLVIELLDARAPLSSQNPLLDELCQNKPRLKVLTKQDLADNEMTKTWLDAFAKAGYQSIAIDLNARHIKKIILKKVKTLVAREYTVIKPLRVMVMGIPNVGKSTLINQLAGQKVAKVGNTPAVTKVQQQIKIAPAVVVFDTPGVLWPKPDNEAAFYRLALLGTIHDRVVDYLDLALFGIEFLQSHYPDVLRQRYSLTSSSLPAEKILEQIGKVRGAITQGQVDLHRAAELLVGDLRQGRLGCLTLETPK